MPLVCQESASRVRRQGPSTGFPRRRSAVCPGIAAAPRAHIGSASNPEFRRTLRGRSRHRAPAPKSRLTVFYVVLAAVTASVAAIVVSARVRTRRAQPSIAGGYDARRRRTPASARPPAPPAGKPLPQTAPAQAASAGPSFDVKQSGQFVNLSNTQGTLGGKLRLDEERAPSGSRAARPATSTASNGKTQRVRGHGDARRQGRDRRHARRRSRSPPTSSATRPTPAPPSRARPARSRALYKLVAALDLLRRQVRARGRAARPTTSRRADKDLGTLAYDNDKGAVTGDVECIERRRRRSSEGQAVDRNLNNFQLIPLDEAQARSRAGRPRRQAGADDAVRAAARAARRFTATKQRESFGHLVAAFFIAVARRDARRAPVRHRSRSRSRQPRVMGEVVAGITLGPTILGAIAPERPGARSSRSDILPRVRGRGQPRPDLLHVPGRARARPEPAQGPGHARRRRSRTRASRCR